MSRTEPLRSPVRERLLARTLTQVVQRGMQAFPEVFATAPGAREARVVGLDPIRVLVIGSGVALGWGAPSQQEALTGALAQQVHERTGRGAVVINRAVETQRVEQTVEQLGGVGAATYPIVVWCPSLFDVVRSPERGRHHRTLLEGLQLLHETAPPTGVVVLCSLPVPTDRGPIEQIARTFVPRYNAALRRAAAPLPGVRVAETPSFSSLADPAAFSAGYYRRWADLLLESTALQRPHAA